MHRESLMHAPGAAGGEPIPCHVREPERAASGTAAPAAWSRRCRAGGAYRGDRRCLCGARLAGHRTRPAELPRDAGLRAAGAVHDERPSSRLRCGARLGAVALAGRAADQPAWRSPGTASAPSRPPGWRASIPRRRTSWPSLRWSRATRCSRPATPWGRPRSRPWRARCRSCWRRCRARMPCRRCSVSPARWRW